MASGAPDFAARFHQHLEAIAGLQHDSIFGLWRYRLGVSLADERARRVTIEQAILDLELLDAYERPADREAEEREAWYEDMGAQDADQAPAAVDLGGEVPDVDAGNTDAAAALARLRAMRGHRTVADDESYEIVNLLGD